jgi:hypothetical protein
MVDLTRRDRCWQYTLKNKEIDGFDSTHVSPASRTENPGTGSCEEIAGSIKTETAGDAIVSLNCMSEPIIAVTQPGTSYR